MYIPFKHVQNEKKTLCGKEKLALMDNKTVIKMQKKTMQLDYTFVIKKLHS